MKLEKQSFTQNSLRYVDKLHGLFNQEIFTQIEKLAKDLLSRWEEGKKCLYLVEMVGVLLTLFI